eukprot:NODE_566_length_6624_cov_0.216245.p2 type:complete len:491 gc:universal NODE_566_length_6624_cov_0.216245:1529-3001(+)
MNGLYSGLIPMRLLPGLSAMHLLLCLMLIRWSEFPRLSYFQMKVNSSWPKIVSQKKFIEERMKLDFSRISANLNRRRCGHLFDIRELSELNAEVEYLEKMKIQTRTLQNKLSKTYKGDLNESIKLKLKGVKESYKQFHSKYKSSFEKLNRYVLSLPNDVSEYTQDYEQVLYQDDISKCLRAVEHDKFGVKNDLIDFQNAAKISGNSFYFLKNKAVWLEMALIMYALRFYESKGFKLLTTPDIVYKHVKDACGFLPRNSDEVEDYSINGGNKVLCATAEIPIAGMLSNKLFTVPSSFEPNVILGNSNFIKSAVKPVEIHEFPQLYVGVGKAYRPETGSMGSSSRGLYRVHQFNKVELFSVCLPGTSNQVFEYIVKCQLEFFKSLFFKLKILEMPDFELGASAHRKIDIEAYFNGKSKFGELSSTSNCTDYQSNRLNIKYKYKDKSHLTHTVNGTGCAIQRTIACGLEAWQIDNKVHLPEALSRITGFTTIP